MLFSTFFFSPHVCLTNANVDKPPLVSRARFNGEFGATLSMLPTPIKTAQKHLSDLTNILHSFMCNAASVHPLDAFPSVVSGREESVIFSLKISKLA